MKVLFKSWIARLPALLRALGPYAAIELLLPGGSVIALLIWLCRHRANIGGPAAGARAAALNSDSLRIPPHLSLPLFHGPVLIYSTHSNPRMIQRRDLCVQHALQARQQ